MNRRSASEILFTIAFFAALLNLPSSIAAGEAPWQSEWEKTVKAAEQEGQVVYSASGSHRFLEEFHKAFPKIKTVVVSAS